MFHVERTGRGLITTGKIAIIFLIFILSGCRGTVQRTTIPDYLVLPNGKEILGNKGLHAFIFENVQGKLTFTNFIMNKFKLNNYKETDFWITIDGEKYKLLIYDNSELEKYFVVSDFIITNLKPETLDEDAPKFIAISMISSTNDDCLDPKSIYYNIATNYLKNLKEEYYKFQ